MKTLKQFLSETKLPKGTKIRRSKYSSEYYFPSYQAARQYAKENGFPTDRIISYDLGWAIQLRISGPYVGPDTKK